MLLKLFLTFLKINLLCTSGPASIGLTKELVVPSIVPESEFVKMASIATGIPGSDAMQMAWQVGYYVKGWIGALITVLGALLPSIALLGLVYWGLTFVNPKVLTKFFDGVTPALAILLITTALGLVKPMFGGYTVVLGIALVSTMLVYLKVPATFILIIAGLVGLVIFR